MSYELPPDERRCTATSKRSGQRCQRWAIPGGAVCAMHGGNAPAVRKAAARRLLRARLDGELAPYLGDLELDPSDVDPVQVLARAVARAEAVVDVWAAKAGQLDLDHGDGGGSGGLTGPDHLGDERISVVMGELRSSLETVGKLARSAIDADLGERLTRAREILSEAQAALATWALVGSMLDVAEHLRRELEPAEAARAVRLIAEAFGPAAAARLRRLEGADGEAMPAFQREADSMLGQLDALKQLPDPPGPPEPVYGPPRLVHPVVDVGEVGVDG